MADFCLQCALDMWGPDIPNDFIGLSTEKDTENGLYCVVLCEGCGAIQVDHTGKCISEDCIEKHGAWEKHPRMSELGQSITKRFPKVLNTLAEDDQ